MVAGERAQRVPGDLRVVMAVIVDKARARRPGRSASIVRVAGPLSLPISTILPSLTPTSPRNAGIPDPSTMRPFLINRSYAIATPFLDQLPDGTLTRRMGRNLHREIGGMVFLSRMAACAARPTGCLGAMRRSTIGPNPKRGESDDAETVRRRSLSRRSLLAGTAGFAGAAALIRKRARSAKRQSRHAGERDQQPAARLGARGHPSIYPDPDVIVVDPSFLPLRRTQGAIYRVWTGALWAEGPAWSSQGRYVVFSDVSGNVQYRYIWDDGRVTVFRHPSYNSNGNTFDFQGRQISCEHFNRRVVRWEHDGIDDRHRRFLRRQAAQLAERPRAASRRQHLVHRSALWRFACRRSPGRAGRPEQSARDLQSAHRRRERRRDRRAQTGIVDQCLSLGPERPARRRDHRGPAGRPQRHLLFARLQDALRDQHRQRSGRYRTGRHRARSMLSTCRAPKSPICGCSPT